MFPKEHPEFITITCLKWLHLLARDNHKQIVVESLDFLATHNRVIVYAFVIMSNHLHMIWQYRRNYEAYEVIRDFLKYTSQQLLRHLAEKDMRLFKQVLVDKSDRRFQVWKRNSLRIPLWSDKVFNQKLDYIHWNPVRAGLCASPEEYKYSSASFYLTNNTEWKFLTHADG
jgi:putative transposase